MEGEINRFKFFSAIEYQNLEKAKLYISDIDKEYISWTFIHTLTNHIFSDIGYDVIKLLLENGADPNSGDSLRHYKTALHYINFSAMNGVKTDKTNYDKLVKLSMLLLDYGANPNQTCLVVNRPTPWKDLYWCKDIRLIKKYLEKGADPQYHIDSLMNMPDIYKLESPLYRISKNYIEKLETKKKAEEKVRQLVVQKLYHRVGGLNLDRYF